MEPRISALDELHMTHAIEKAASLAVADETKDRDQLLADCLMKSNVDSRFAKTASMAFNKRLTVLKFQQTPDDKRPDSFKLSDPDTVFAKMGGVEKGQEKKASAAKPAYSEFSIGLAEPPMEKAAAAKPSDTRELYEARVPLHIFEEHLESLLDKQAMELPHKRHEVEDLGVKLELSKKAAAETLNGLTDFHYSLIDAVYGDKLEKLLGDKLVKRAFRKQAGVVKPDNKLTRQLDKLIEDNREYARKRNDLVDYENGLCELCKSAADFKNDMVKLALSPAATVGTLLRGGASSALTALQGAEAVRKASNEALAAGFGNAAALGGSVDNGTSPGKVLDAEFLIKDRFRDRLMGWSDMTADPLFSIYPSSQVFAATQKAMDLDPAMERPDKREMLRAAVGQLLAQNNRFSAADIAANAQTLKALQGADKPAANEAAESVFAMDKEKGPEKPELISLFDIAGKAPGIDTGKDYIQAASAVSQKEMADAEKSKSDRASKNAERIENLRREFVAWLRAANIRTNTLPSGEVQFLDSAGNVMDGQGLLAHFAMYRSNLQNQLQGLNA